MLVLMTRDIDIVKGLPTGDVERLIAGLKDAYHIDPNSAGRAMSGLFCVVRISI